MTTTAETAQFEKNAAAAKADIAAEITKADSKATAILTTDGLLIAGLSLLGGKLAWPSIALAGLGAVALVGSMVAAVWTIRPTLKKRSDADRNFLDWGTATLDEIKTDLQGDQRLERIKTLSGIAKRKFARVRLAGDAAIAAVVLIAAAALTK